MEGETSQGAEMAREGPKAAGAQELSPVLKKILPFLTPCHLPPQFLQVFR